MKKDRTCGICLEHVKQGLETPFDCSSKHVTHAICVLAWYKTKAVGTSHISCPTCSKQLNPKLRDEATMIIVAEFNDNIAQERMYAKVLLSKWFILTFNAVAIFIMFLGTGFGYMMYPAMQDLMNKKSQS